jgi:alpha-glucuronidase
MNTTELQEILKDYIGLICKEQGQIPKQYTNSQMKVMSKKLEIFASHCKEDETLLLFFYTWYSLRETYPQKTLWEKAFKGSSVSKEELQQMCKSWSSLENTIIEFTEENQIVFDKEPNKDLEQEL